MIEKSEKEEMACFDNLISARFEFKAAKERLDKAMVAKSAADLELAAACENHSVKLDKMKHYYNAWVNC